LSFRIGFEAGGKRDLSFEKEDPVLRIEKLTRYRILTRGANIDPENLILSIPEAALEMAWSKGRQASKRKTARRRTYLKSAA